MSKFIEKIKKSFKRIYKYFNNLLICLRFPFLYPRNRFDGTHYTWYWLDGKIRNFENNRVVHVNLKLYNNEEVQRFQKEAEDKGLKLNNIIHDDFFDCDVACSMKDGFIMIETFIGNKPYIWKLHLNDAFDFVIPEKLDKIKLYWIEDTRPKLVQWSRSKPLNMIVEVPEELILQEDVNKYHRYNTKDFYLDNFKALMYKSLRFFHDKILQWIMFIPKYTELDAMPTGWRKAFGIQMCKEIRRALLKNGGLKALFNYRIMQIKEKFGGLRWYDGYSNDEIFRIIDKYEDLSYKTCIDCGKPATKMSKGWISPYCDDCATGDPDHYTPIDNPETCPF